MKLVIVHFHLRPGGIRRVIELAVPHLLKRLQRVDGVVLACGEADDRKWNTHFTKLLHPLPVTFFVEPALGYLSEQKSPAGHIARRIRSALEQIFRGQPGGEFLVWAHNLGIGRNLLLARELACFCDEQGIRLVSHHHDWWFDNRWMRWPQMQRAGFRTLDSVARAIFPASATVRHMAISQTDSAPLKRHLRSAAGWLPNPASENERPAPARVREARSWLEHKLGGHPAPVWILPCRLLRRKNVAEALLLTRWLRPEAWCVTTGGVSSADETAYYKKLNDAAHHHHWRLRLGVLSGDEQRKPSVSELLAVSECVLLTSIQEGFGLPFLEAAAARRPLIARALPNIAPDLKKFGFRFPQYYDEVLVAPELFDWRAERVRQARMFRAWKAHLPRHCRAWAGKPVLLAQNRPRPVPFSRLTLTAQLEVLARPATESWICCAPLNPFLKKWRAQAAEGRLQISPWPRTADGWLGGRAYAAKFCEVATANERKPGHTPVSLQNNFIREKLGAGQLFPLLWSCAS